MPYYPKKIQIIKVIWKRKKGEKGGRLLFPQDQPRPPLVYGTKKREQVRFSAKKRIVSTRRQRTRKSSCRKKWKKWGQKKWGLAPFSV